jgi:hypothetical protein
MKKMIFIFVFVIAVGMSYAEEQQWRRNKGIPQWAYSKLNGPAQERIPGRASNRSSLKGGGTAGSNTQFPSTVEHWRRLQEIHPDDLSPTILGAMLKYNNGMRIAWRYIDSVTIRAITLREGYYAQEIVIFY